jgi:hypothetical protein
MKTESLYLPLRLLLVMFFFLISSCVSAPMKGYDGPEVSADKTAIIENGVYLDIVKCDGVRLGSFQNSIIVLPGEHTIDMVFHTQMIGDNYLYSRDTASVTFKVEAGHIYVAYARRISPGGWIASIKDKKTDEQVAQSAILELIGEWMFIDLR